MSLTQEQKDAFKAIFIETVTNFAQKVGQPTEKVFLQILPLTVVAGTEYLKSYEEDLKTKLEDSKAKSQKIIGALSTVKEPEKIEKSGDKHLPLGELLGKRVQRGEDWKWDDQDGGIGSFGKVVGVKGNGWVKVQWESSRNENRYRWGVDKAYDVKVVEVVDDLGDIPPLEEQIKKPTSWVIGKSVIRGRDWKWKDQDGGQGQIGEVIDVCDEGWVEVKWKNGTVCQYRWGGENAYDLQVVPKPKE
ncbi:hypothetical protein ENUP19_0359G0011 [Entamoeba nuttalli]|uniref:HECT domain and RCC1 family domain containing protein, putative n=2 Tax=Entamoeba nuttalli TaxID=412467 RepID=K2I1S1_ENTNP|nr:HECT domain and RCC1 family domain containing protein, putative [Entamoeba nuttalli P19]EKE42715.1 HECT domain and RCC1 family domain containing protein, putative [Entamoeba nuttalli P19]|eukprot:XP_008854953.1 HECT domain and RCC1 family domain containing protein, putative [Entamoeba nuttalli P19]